MPSTVRYKKGSSDVSATASYYGGALPVGGDTFEMDEGVGAFDQVANALAGVDLLAFNVRRGCSVNIGSASAPFEVDIDQTGTGVFRYEGAGQEVWLSGGSGGAIHTVIFSPAAQTVMRLMACDNDVLQVFSGTMIVPSTTTVIAVEVTGPGQAVLQQHASDTTGAVTVNAGATLTTRRRIAAASTVAAGGTLKYDVDSTTTTSTITVNGTLELTKGSITVDLKPGAVLDASRLEKTGFTIAGTGAKGSTIIVGANAPTLSITGAFDKITRG